VTSEGTKIVDVLVGGGVVPIMTGVLSL